MPDVIYNGKRFKAQRGELLSHILMANAVPHSHPCGGRGVCKKCTVLVDGKEELSCRYCVENDIVVTAEEISGGCAVNEPTTPTAGRLCYAVDVGTTTLAVAAVGLESGKAVRVITRTNPQCAFGADVISRIDYCRKNSFKPLQQVLVSRLCSMAAELGCGRLSVAYVAGNTVMLHILTGADPGGMGAAPYTPAFLAGLELAGEEIGLNFADTVITLPNISPFVGADIVAGINFAGRPPQGRYSLLIDLGTNAELALIGREKLICTSAAAGPCFEGANISCGMGAQNGAICEYSGGEYKTIGGFKAVGICGTGLVDVIAQLLGNEIDENGYMPCGRLEIAPGVYLSQEDVREFQLAKSAVCSAVQVLLSRGGVSAQQIDAVYISGGFSAQLNAKNAADCGLIPSSLAQKCVALNNSSLMGTVKYAAEKADLTALVRAAEYIDLATDEQFAGLFMKNMSFAKQQN